MKDLDKDKNRENITRAEFFRIIMMFPIKIVLTFLKRVFTIPFLTMLGVWILVYYQFMSHSHKITGWGISNPFIAIKYTSK